MAATEVRQRVSPFWSRGFTWYVARYLRRHMHAVRVVAGSVPHLDAQTALICYANHPSWWDPLVAYFLNQRFFRPRQFFAPIAQQALAQYPIFERLGFYGLEQGTLAGARVFLRQTSRLLEDPSTAIWLTPGGEFCDVRHPSTFQPGLAHLVHHLASQGGRAAGNPHAADPRAKSGMGDNPVGTAGHQDIRPPWPRGSGDIGRRPGIALVPMAVEYVFWQERTPEVLVEFGPPQYPLAAAGHGDPAVPGERRSKSEWQAMLERRLVETQAELAGKAMARDASCFDVALCGRSGIGGPYDWARRLRAYATGQRFDPRHGRAADGNH